MLESIVGKSPAGKRKRTIDIKGDESGPAGESNVALVDGCDPLGMDCEDIPDENDPVANLSDCEGDCEKTTISERDCPCAIEDVEGCSANSDVSQDLSGLAKRGTVYLSCQGIECGAG